MTDTVSSDKQAEGPSVTRSQRLVSCVDCGHDVSTRAFMCPGCGREARAASLGWILAAITGLLSLILLFNG